MFDVNSVVIDRAIRGTLFDKSTGEVIFTINNIKDPSLECSGETVFSTDAVGCKIASFDRSKDATLSGSNALIDFGLFAAQLGSDKTTATNTAKILVPKFEEVKVTKNDDNKNVLALNKKPAGTAGAEVKFIYTVKQDRSLGNKYACGTDTATQFSVDADGKEILLPTGYDAETDGDTFYVWYDYEADGATGNGAVEIINSAIAFAKGGRFDLEVIFCDICNPNLKYYGHVVFDNAKMDNSVSVNFNNEAEHGFSIQCNQDYCSAEKKLFRIVIPE